MKDINGGRAHELHRRLVDEPGRLHHGAVLRPVHRPHGWPADRIGRVRITLLGIVLGIVGSALLICCATGASRAAAAARRARHPGLLGRLHHAGHDGAGEDLLGRRRTPAGRLHVVDRLVGWLRPRAPCSAAPSSSTSAGAASSWPPSSSRSSSFLMILGTPESKVGRPARSRSTSSASRCFMVGTLGLMIVLLFGSKLGWASPPMLVLALVAIVGVRRSSSSCEREARTTRSSTSSCSRTPRSPAPRSRTSCSTARSACSSCQPAADAAGAGRSPDAVGVHRLGRRHPHPRLRRSSIIAFIRVGEKLLQRFGPRKPMIWGSLIVIVACLAADADHTCWSGST